jgi:hypothetical protein
MRPLVDTQSYKDEEYRKWMIYNRGSQPGYRGTLGYPEKLKGAANFRAVQVNFYQGFSQVFYVHEDVPQNWKKKLRNTVFT